MPAARALAGSRHELVERQQLRVRQLVVVLRHDVLAQRVSPRKGLSAAPRRARKVPLLLGASHAPEIEKTRAQTNLKKKHCSW